MQTEETIRWALGELRTPFLPTRLTSTTSFACCAAIPAMAPIEKEELASSGQLEPSWFRRIRRRPRHSRGRWVVPSSSLSSRPAVFGVRRRRVDSSISSDKPSRGATLRRASASSGSTNTLIGEIGVVAAENLGSPRGVGRPGRFELSVVDAKHGDEPHDRSMART